ncbi:Mitochondrial Rho GTPase [Quillaja saponaria]|uniref:Mitochondrial Rho GTPase n=1 Tax=Quillaja saponaria TaxID=32244 RepID=A0AAD7KMH9_QUISA|nr:Mitochondrial Rho GTPase [Quillaja saponaria]
MESHSVTAALLVCCQLVAARNRQHAACYAASTHVLCTTLSHIDLTATCLPHAATVCPAWSKVTCQGTDRLFLGGHPLVLPPTRLTTELYADRVPLTIIVSSSSFEIEARHNEEVHRADAVVLAYACDELMTLTL